MQRYMLDGVSIKEPIPLGSWGTIFWSPTYCAASGELPEAENFEKFCELLDKKEWRVYFGTPNENGSFHLTINLRQPLRASHNAIRFDIDYLMGTLSTEVNADGNQSFGRKAEFEKLAIPKEIVFGLKDLLREFVGEVLFCHYHNAPDGDPRELYIEFENCHKLTKSPDELLRYIAEKLSQIISPEGEPLPV